MSKLDQRPRPLGLDRVRTLTPTRDDLRPCEYAVRASREFPHQPRVLARIELDDTDRQLIASGAVLWLELDGGELPWQLHLTDPRAEVPA